MGFPRIIIHLFDSPRYQQPWINTRITDARMDTPFTNISVVQKQVFFSVIYIFALRSSFRQEYLFAAGRPRRLTTICLHDWTFVGWRILWVVYFGFCWITNGRNNMFNSTHFQLELLMLFIYLCICIALIIMSLDRDDHSTNFMIRLHEILNAQWLTNILYNYTVHRACSIQTQYPT